jgi:hypothetical protein
MVKPYIYTHIGVDMFDKRHTLPVNQKYKKLFTNFPFVKNKKNGKSLPFFLRP